MASHETRTAQAEEIPRPAAHDRVGGPVAPLPAVPSGSGTSGEGKPESYAAAGARTVVPEYEDAGRDDKRPERGWVVCRCLATMMALLCRC